MGKPSPESPAQHLASFIARFDPAIAKLVRAARARLRKRMPGANELVYDNCNALAIGFGSTERASDVVISLAVYARGINLYFMYGAWLDDPEELLQGNGNQGRFIRLESVQDLDRPGVAALLDAALESAEIPMPDGRRGALILKSESARPRPRRPEPAKAPKKAGKKPKKSAAGKRTRTRERS